MEAYIVSSSKVSFKETDTKVQYVPVTQESVSHVDSSDIDEIDLAGMLRVLWSNKYAFFIIVILFLVGSIFYTLSKPNIYRATVLLAPVEAESSSGIGALAGQFSGIASLGGINLGGASSKVDLVLETLASRAFIQQFVEQNNLSILLLATREWASDTNEIVVDENVYDTNESSWKGQYASLPTNEPTPWQIFESFSERLDIAKDKESGFITISFNHVSPKEATRVLSLLVNQINEHMRTQDQIESTASITYLKNELSKTTISSMQAIFYQLIEEQTKNIMLTQVKVEYALKVIDPPNTPDSRHSPKRTQTVVIGVILGVIFGILFVYFRYTYNKIRDRINR